jgi:hypothetical protein
MAIEELTPRQQTLIVNNVVKAVKHGIDNLNKTGYNFMYQASGFIAHYNMYGFIAHYQQYSLKRDILDNVNANLWKNFHPGEQNYEYYKSKAEVYQRIVDHLENYS